MSREQHLASTVPSSFDRDLENARVLIEDEPWRDNPQRYRKVAEAILRRILRFDPENQAAKRLLAKAAAPLPLTEAAAPPPPLPPTPSPQQPRLTPPSDLSQPRLAPPSDLSFVVQTPAPRADKTESRRPPWVLIGFAVVGAIAGVLLLFGNRSPSQSPPKAPKVVPAASKASTGRGAIQAPPAQGLPVSAAAAVHPPANPDPPKVETFPVTPPAVVKPAVPPAVVKPAVPPAVVKPAVPPAVAKSAVPPPVVKPAVSQVVVKSAVPPVAPIQTGTLAVSSPTTVEIYLGNEHVASAPTSLVLPAGNQTLEFRHQDMRKTLTYTVKANETTTAMITFDIPVQINARPWAQVFIDGPQRKPLGQTPLSEVRVPIGSLLIFENPNFPGKSYRVTGRETEIRVTFP